MYENISWMFATLGEEGAPVILFQVEVAFGQLKDIQLISNYMLRIRVL